LVKTNLGKTMKKIHALFIILIVNIYSQSTEVFETENNGSTTFSDNGQGFTISGAPYDINSFTNGGWNGSTTDNKFIDNTGESAGLDGSSMTITVDNGTDITVSSIYIYAANTSLENHTGSLQVTGYLNGAQVYSFTKSNGFSDVENFTPNNGFTLFDFVNDGASDFSDDLVDAIGFTSTGNLEYMAFDAFSWSIPPATAPEMSVIGNSQTITDGDNTPSVSDNTDFGTVNEGTANISRTFTIDNSGDANLSLSGNPRVAISGSGDFSITRQPASSIAEGANDYFVVTFDPTTVGTQTASISITNDDSDENPYNFDVEGEVLATNPSITLLNGSSASFAEDASPEASNGTDFGTLNLTADATSTFTIENNGSATLDITDYNIIGDDAGEFNFAVNPPSSVTFGPGEADFEVQFDPTSVGIKSATVSIENDASDDGTFTFGIQGTATTTPAAWINTVTNIDFESASITADIFNGFFESSVTFNYGTTSGALDEFVAISGTQAANDATFTVSEDITGLDPNTEYFYEIYVDANGTNTSDEGTFTTDPANAEAYINSESNITGFSASISFDVYNGNTFSSASILYGTTQGSYTGTQEYGSNPISASTTTLTLGQNLTNLNPTTTYYYVIVNENREFSATSTEGTFETGFGNPTIDLISLAPSHNGTSITFDAFNADQSSTITYRLGTTSGVYNQNQEYSQNPFAANSSNQTLTDEIPLNAETEYFLSLQIENANASASTSETSFWTLSEPPTHSNTFYQIGEEDTQIELAYKSLADNGSDGYIILRSTSVPNTYPSNSNTYNIGATLGNSEIVDIIEASENPNLTSSTLTGLPKERSYIFTLIPYNSNGTDEETTNYLTQDAPTVSGYTIPTLGEWGMIGLIFGISFLALAIIRKF
jgi:hypothetical protein